MAEWKLQEFRDSSYELVASCCRRTIVVGAPELDGLIARFGGGVGLNQATKHAVCKECRLPLAFTVRPRGQEKWDWPRQA